MACNLVIPISGTECIGDSRTKINNNFDALCTAINTLSAETVVRSPGGTTSTINSYVIGAGRILYSDVRNNSLSTIHISNEAVTNAKLAFDGGSLGFRNKIINGGFDIDQRNVGAIVTYNGTNDGVYHVDRWRSGRLWGTGSFTVNREAFIPADTVLGRQFNFGLRIKTSAAVTAMYLMQQIESVYTLAGQTATLSFYTTRLGNAPTNCFVYLRQYYGDSGSAFVDLPVQTFAVTQDEQRHSFTFNIPSLLGKTVSGGNDSLSVIIAWSASGATDWGITGVQLEEGLVATPFEQRPIGLELSLCQRYYEKSYNLNTLPGTATVTGSEYQRYQYVDTVNGEYRTCNFRVDKRIIPAISLYATKDGALNFWTDTSTAGNPNIFVQPTTTYAGTRAFNVNIRFLTGASLAIAGHWTADAEL